MREFQIAFWKEEGVPGLTRWWSWYRNADQVGRTFELVTGSEVISVVEVPCNG